MKWIRGILRSLVLIPVVLATQPSVSSDKSRNGTGNPEHDEVLIPPSIADASVLQRRVKLSTNAKSAAQHHAHIDRQIRQLIEEQDKILIRIAKEESAIKTIQEKAQANYAAESEEKTFGKQRAANRAVAYADKQIEIQNKIRSLEAEKTLILRASLRPERLELAKKGLVCKSGEIAAVRALEGNPYIAACLNKDSLVTSVLSVDRDGENVLTSIDRKNGKLQRVTTTDTKYNLMRESVFHEDSLRTVKIFGSGETLQRSCNEVRKGHKTVWLCSDLGDDNSGVTNKGPASGSGQTQ